MIIYKNSYTITQMTQLFSPGRYNRNKNPRIRREVNYWSCGVSEEQRRSPVAAATPTTTTTDNLAPGVRHMTTQWTVTVGPSHSPKFVFLVHP